MTGAPRALFVTDSDSYVKWGAALAGQVPKDWSVRLVVARGNARPSDRQVREALAGTRFGLGDATVVGRAELADILQTWRPDVVVAATRGLTVQSIVSMVEDGADRPVLVSGLAGISVPVLAPGLRMRRSADVFVVQSHRELREFAAMSAEIGVPLRYELATIPFLATAPTLVTKDSMHDPGTTEPVRDRIVFAAQAMVPGSRRERMHLLDRLIATASANPHLKVIVKVRAHEGEPQTHVEQFPYDQLLIELIESGVRIPPNLSVESGAMAWQLRRAVGFATISSTAILEAVAEGVPCLAIDEFGVGAAQINLVLLGSGLIGPIEDLVAGTFRHPDPVWLDDNYLHDPADNTWVPAVEGLLDQRRERGLPPLPALPGGLARRIRSWVYGRLAFAPANGADPVHSAFLVVGFWEHRRRWAVSRLRDRARARVPGA